MSRGLDHLVIATRHLDASAELYRRLGFQVGQRNRHPWGTLNHIVQFPGCFLELIGFDTGFSAVPEHEPVAHFANFLAAYLARREGLAMLVLESRDAAGDQADFAAHGISGRSTFFFERTGKRADGSDVRVAFTLAFAATPTIGGAGFFVCQQHVPENFWTPAFQVHDNGVTGVTAVVMVADEPIRHAAFLDAYTGGGQVGQIAGGISVRTARGRIDVLSPEAVLADFGVRPVLESGEGARFVAVRFACPDMERARTALAKSGVASADVGAGIVVADALGVALAFAPPEPNIA